MTPWGEAGALRQRRLRPGPGVPPEDVERNQRERLYGAMVAVATTVGYGQTRVSDLIEVAGVSRATFYRYFANKEECLLATLDGVISATLAATEKPIGREGSWEERAHRGIAAFTQLLVSQSAGARMCLVEANAAGPAAVKRVDDAMVRFEQIMSFTIDQISGEGQAMPPELIAALTGGLRKVVHTRLHRHMEHELVDLVPELLELGISYPPPPEPLRYSGPRPAGAVNGAAANGAGGDPGARIEAATLAAVAERGYAETALSDIAAEAGVSLSTFYAHFDSKERAFSSALHSARMRMMAAVEPAFRRSRSWVESTRTGIEAGFAFMESEPDFARVTTIDVYGAGAVALERLDNSIEKMHRFVDGGFELAPDVQPIAREAIPSAMYAMLCNRVRSHGTEGLRELTPLATYLVLAPFLGAEEACHVANSGSQTRRRKVSS